MIYCISHLANSMDKEEIIIKDRRNNYRSYSNIQFKENCIEGHLLARDILRRSSLLYAFIIVKEFIDSKRIAFYAEGIRKHIRNKAYKEFSYNKYN